MIFSQPLFSVQKLTCGLMFCFCFISYPSTIPSSHTSSLLYPSHAYNLKQCILLILFFWFSSWFVILFLFQEGKASPTNRRIYLSRAQDAMNKCHFFWQESWTDEEIDSKHCCNEPESQVCGSEASSFR